MNLHFCVEIVEANSRVQFCRKVLLWNRDGIKS